MKKLKGLSLILCITMLLGIFNISVYAQNTITAYITISKYGEIVTDKNGETVAVKPVTLTGKDSYTLDDVFCEAHELYYEGGAAEGYATEVGQYGLGLSKAWGDTSGKFGYQINLGAVDVWGPTQAVNDGDYVDLCIYESYYPDTESYAKFDAYKKNTNNDTTELTLYESYYGENGEILFSPCSGAIILVDGEETSIVTDENGKCTLSFDNYGEYLISATKTKTLIDEVDETESVVAAITAPVCIVTFTRKITAYITISINGEIVADKNGDLVAEAPVTLTGKDSYTLDDVFCEAHELYYEGGAAAGYATEFGQYGLGVSKAWGDTSGKFGYQLNFGIVDVWGPTQDVSDGDYVDLCVYENYHPDTESYAKFDVAEKMTTMNYETELTLYESYYGPNWEILFRKCQGATILVDGEETSIVTDENGKCNITFEAYGKHIISAKKTKVLVDEVDETESIVAAITAPVCVVTVAPASIDCRYQLNIAVDASIDIDNAKTIVVGYKDGKLIDMIMDDIVWSGNTTTIYLNKKATDISLFLWNSAEEQEPLIKVERINLK